MKTKRSTPSGTCQSDEKILDLLRTHDPSKRALALQLMCGMQFKRCCRILASYYGTYDNNAIIALLALFNLPKRCRHMEFDQLQKENVRFTPKERPHISISELNTFFPRTQGDGLMEHWNLEHEY